MRFQPILASLICTSLLVAACGDDDDASTDDVPTADDVPAADSGDETEGDTAAASFPAECPGAAPFDVELRAEGEDPLASFTVTDAAALRRSDGLAYTVYLADFTLPDELSQFTLPEVPEGGLLISTGLDRFNVDPETIDPLEEGASGPLFPEAGPAEESGFLNFRGDAAGTTSSNQEGTVTMLGLSDDRICLDVNITSDRGGALVGVVEAAIEVDV